MLTEETKALLEAASGLVVGITRPDGRPHATRGFGLDIDPSGERAVLVMNALDAAGCGLQPGDAPSVPIAITAGDLRTLASVQVKGTLVEVLDGGPEGVARKDRYCDEFTVTVHEVDGTDLAIAERWRPAAVVRCRLELDELFVQTPGPGAGKSLGKVTG